MSKQITSSWQVKSLDTQPNLLKTDGARILRQLSVGDMKPTGCRWPFSKQMEGWTVSGSSGDG
jgi:hypothetical protein